jgi:putative ABC transport system permease protein
VRRALRTLRISARALGAHPLRTALCVAGTAVGIAGVLVLSAIGAGAREAVLRQIDAMGRDVVVVTPPPVNARTRVVRRDAALTRALRLGDAEALVRAAPEVLRAAPAADRDLYARTGGTWVKVGVIGTTPDWLAIRRFDLLAGRFFTVSEERELARVAVLGAKARELLFRDGAPAVGGTILIGSVPFTVVGELAAKGLSATGSATEDDKIIIPLATARRRVFGSDAVKMLYVELRPGASESAVAAVLRARRDLARSNGPEMRLDGQRVVAEAREAAQRPLQRLLLALSGLSLLVAGVGVSATMLLSVRERRSEIGLRLAVGARRRDLIAQFLLESAALAGVGGTVGLALGTIGAQAMSSWTRWQASLAPSVLLAAVGGTVLLGVVAGVWPAWRAATMDPVSALAGESR